jgi:WD40 repeat protein
VTSGQQAVAEATAAVFVGGRRVGSAVLVDGGHLLTAAHVLRHRDEGSAVLADEVELLFAAVSPQGEARVPAKRAPLNSGCDSADVAVLDIGVELPPWLPKPVPLSPVLRQPARVSVLGFPLAEKSPRGVWRQFSVAGPTADGAVQLDWAGDVGTLRGQSGGPVIDTVSSALVGVLIEGSPEGKFDRFLPLTLIRHCWEQLPQPWLMAGLEGRSHFDQRARGQPSRARGGDLFRGRSEALAVIRGWLTAEEPPGRPLVVTGQPGAGKSSVLGRTAVKFEAERIGPGLAFHAKAATSMAFVRALEDLTGASDAGTADALLDALTQSPSVTPMLVLVDALDEAASEGDRGQIADLLTELALLPGLRVAVATRALSSGGRFAPDGLLYALGVTSGQGAHLVDLDADRYFDPEALEQFASALLAQDGAERPGPADGAWRRYREDDSLRHLLAGLIARRADRNYLVAAMTASRLSTLTEVVNAATPDAVAVVSTGVGEALRGYLAGLPDGRRVRTRALLAALAYARGIGIDDQLWLRFSAALGQPATVADLELLRHSAIADYLLQTVTEPHGLVSRLFHQALADELVASRESPADDERRLYETLIDSVRSDGWPSAPPYLRTYAADHAAAANRLDVPIAEAGYLGIADFPHLLPLLAPGTSAGDSPAGLTVRRAASRAATLPHDRRMGLLALTAAHFGFRSLQRQLTAERAGPFQVRWAHNLGSPHLELVAGPRGVSALALGRAGGRDVVAVGGGDGTLWVWQVVGGRKVWEAPGAHDGWVRAVAVGRVAGRDVIVSGGGDDGMVRVWDGASGQLVGGALPAHGTSAGAVAVGRVAGRDVIVSGGGDDGMVRVWDGASGQLVGDALPAGSKDDRVSAVAVCRIADVDHVVAVASGAVRIWRQGSDGRFADPPESITRPGSVAWASRDGRCMVLSGSYNSTLEVRDAFTGTRICTIPTHYAGVREVAAGQIGGRDVVVTADGHDALRAWDTSTGQSFGDTLTGHTSQVTAVAVGVAGGGDVIASGDGGGSVRLWETHMTLTGDPLKGHTEQVNAVAVGRVRGKEVIVSGGADSMMLFSKASSGGPASDPVDAHIFGITTVAVGKLRGKDVIISGGRDGEIRVWDLETGQGIGEPTHPAWDQGSLVGIDQVALAEDVLASVDMYGRASIWKAKKGLLARRSLRGDDQYEYSTSAVVAGRLNGRSVVVTGRNDGSVQIWNASDGRPVGKAFKAAAEGRVAITAGRVGGLDVIVSGSEKGEVCIWDAGKCRQIGTAFNGHTGEVTGVAM